MEKKDQILNISRLLGSLPDLTAESFSLNSSFVSEILKHYDEKPLGKGGMGAVYRIRNHPEWVLKISDPCLGVDEEGNSQGKSSSTGPMCQALRNRIVDTIPHEGKRMLVLPNYVSENIIGGMMTELVQGGYTPHFTQVLGGYWDLATNKVYAILEALQTKLEKIIRSPEEVHHFFFQVAMALSTAEWMRRFTHYDLHAGNVLYKEDPGYDYLVYRDPNNRPVVTRHPGWLAKISDYGLSRAENERVAIMPQRFDYSKGPFNHGGAYRSNYDLFALYGSLFVAPAGYLDLGDSQAAFRTHFPPAEQERFLKFLVADPNDTNLHTYKIHDIFLKWRPRLEWLDTHRTTTPAYATAGYFLELLRKDGAATRFETDQEFLLFQRNQERQGKKFRQFRAPLALFEITQPTHRPIKVPAPIVGSLRPISSHTAAPGVVVESYAMNSGEEFNTQRYNIVGFKGCKLLPQYFHVAFINQESAAAAGYEFVSDCCWLDPFTYMSKKRTGLAINGTFFAIRETRRPIGPYYQKDTGIVDTTPIPEKYRSFYRTVVVQPHGIKILGIDDASEEIRCTYCNPFKNTGAVLTGGPVLLENGERVVTEEMMEAVDQENIKIWQSRKPAPDEPADSKYFTSPSLIVNHLTDPFAQEDEGSGDEGSGEEGYGEKCVISRRVETATMPNVDKITAGEIAHGANPNPRTALIIRDPDIAARDGKGEVAFVIVEGRGIRGAGVDLNQLAWICQQMGARTAINLDGGTSSNMTWRTDANPRVLWCINDQRVTNYPVGNVLGIVKKLTKSWVKVPTKEEQLAAMNDVTITAGGKDSGKDSGKGSLAEGSLDAADSFGDLDMLTDAFAN